MRRRKIIEHIKYTQASVKRHELGNLFALNEAEHDSKPQTSAY